MNYSFLKKIIAAFLALTLLTGCGATESSTVSSESEPVRSLAETSLITSDGTARVNIENGTFQVNGKPIWFCGTNTPWDKWDDFGGNFNAVFWDQHFAALHEAGINASRVWILCSGDKGIRFDETGKVIGMTEAFWNHTDQLMEIAARHEIYIMATMMSFDCCKSGNRNHKRFRKMIQDAELAESYVQNYIIPFAKRYDSNDYLYSIDLCNEPDWIHENAECGKLSWKSLTTFFGKCAQGIHQNSDILVTTGIAYIQNHSDIRGKNYISDSLLEKYAGQDSYMDFYSVHFYDWMIRWHGNPFNLSPADYGMPTDKPNVIGECPAKGSIQDGIDLTQAAKKLYANGWHGVFPWTSTGTDENGGFDEVATYAKEMAAEKQAEIFPLAS